MNLAEAQGRVDAIRASAGDDEGAHSMEDALYHDFLRDIAETTTDRGLPTAAAEIARLILTTEALPFARWCA